MTLPTPPICYRHPERLAVEHCEVCQKPLCAECLWYAEEGHRLCPDHAAEFLKEGKTVIPPERYSEGFTYSQASAAQAPAPDVPYKGTSADVSALLAVVVGVASMAACAGFYWIMPFIAVGLGLFAVLQARQAHDPSRTRWLGGVGLATGGVLVVLTVGVFVVFFGCWLAIVAGAFISGSGGPSPSFPTPTPYIFVTPTP